MNFEPKPCQHCGRNFEWRKKWEKEWENVKYCSTKCSKQNKINAKELEKRITTLLKERGPSKSICPSEVLEGADKKNKEKMEQVRCAARRLVHAQKIVITQKNKIVDPSDFKGPIRLKLK